MPILRHFSNRQGLHTILKIYKLFLELIISRNDRGRKGFMWIGFLVGTQGLQKLFGMHDFLDKSHMDT